MRAIVVYGCPCSGKSTYVKSAMGDHDVVFDYDRLLMALTAKNDHAADKHPAHGLVMQLRQDILARLKNDDKVQRVFIITRWPTDALKNMLDGFEVEHEYLQASEKECLDRLAGDDSRPDKEEWETIIRQWHSEHGNKRGVFMKEIRTCELRAQVPAGTDGLTLVGTPIVYEQPTTINDPAGAFTEIIRRGALDGADLSDVRLFYNHDTNRVPLARTPRTMTLELTPAGMSMTAHLPDTQEARSVYAAVERKDLTGMSFAFKISEGGDRYNAATRTREILRIEKVLECSVVPFPAYEQASVEARAAIRETDAKRDRALIACNKILMKEL